MGPSLFVEACGILSCSMQTLNCGRWDLVPWPGMESRSLHWELGVLATGSWGKSRVHYYCYYYFGHFHAANGILGFPSGSDGKESACNAGDMGSIPGLGRSPGGGQGNSLQYSYLENPTESRDWWATVHRVAKSWIWLKQLRMHAQIQQKFPQLISHIKEL